MIPDMQSPDISNVRKQLILVVDDDHNNLAVVRDSLVELNYTILVAEDGESAVQRADYARPDLILLDVMMPGIDGYETCRRLKSQESTKDIPVIFMTALAETGQKVKGLETGAVDYITKPFQREELLARIAVHLHNRELSKSLLEAKESLEIRVEERTAELAQAINALNDEIIERERGEKERVRLARAIEQAAEAIFMCDAQWLFTYVNPAFERISGYARDEVLGRNAAMLRSDSFGPEYYNQIREIINRDNAWSGHITTRRKDAAKIEAEITVSSVKDSQGAIINYVFILRDVTRELRLEQELRQAQKMEAIGTLAGGIAHDFNNILTAIIGSTYLAQQKVAEGDSATLDLERVLVACSRAKNLVNRILTFSRQGEHELKPVHVAEVVDEVLKLMRSSIPSTIEIFQHSSTPPQGDVVLADLTQIHQVLMNLCTNAAHAMRSEGGELSVTLSNVEVDASMTALYPGLNPGSCVRLTVMDSGHGMEESIRDRIFDPYFTTKEVGEGTGMGLAVVQGIIKSLGGAISVYSEPGQGTSFHLFLPQFSGAASNGNTSPNVTCGGTERILFVDDEAMLAELGQELLKSLGYAVTATQSSREALRLFHADPNAYDLVITDMSMPGLTGKELARELMAVRSDIPVILCTGFSDRINEKQAKEAGIREYVMKPYSYSSLDKSIRRVLDPDSSFSSNTPLQV
jgi:PAS domain S-box-containing protein